MKDLPLSVHPPSITPETETKLLTQYLQTQLSTSTSKLDVFDFSEFNDTFRLKRKVSDTRKPSVLLQEHLTFIEQGDNEDAFYVGDVGEIVRQHIQWTQKLPTVQPYYAVKCNPDPMILHTLARLGTGFDCASKAEIDAVLALDTPINASTQIIYANPCKAASHIRHAAMKGVRMMTFDNEDELYKIRKHHSNPLLVLRVLTDDSRSLCQFGVKFGASLSSALSLLQLAKSLNLEVIGVSFHVGSGCFDATAFRDALMVAKLVFEYGAQVGFQFSLLDIGGGFPGAESHTGVKFHAIAECIAPVLKESFSNVRVIAEPGRYYVSSCMTLAVNVHARRTVYPMEGKEKKTSVSFMYYINEGMYSSFNCIYFDHAHVHPRILYRNGKFVYGQPVPESEPLLTCSVWGPTCDSMDVITKECQLPELQVGDWLHFDCMGAYTLAAATTFNGFRKCHVLWTNTEHKFIDI